MYRASSRFYLDKLQCFTRKNTLCRLFTGINTWIWRHFYPKTKFYRWSSILFIFGTSDSETLGDNIDYRFDYCWFDFHNTVVYLMAKYGKGIKKYIVSKINKKTFEMFYTFFSFQKGTSFFGILWKSVMVNFGGQPSPTIIDNFNSYKSVIITSLFGGLVIKPAERSAIFIGFALSPFKSNAGF